MTIDIMMNKYYDDNSCYYIYCYDFSRIRQETIAAEDILHDMGAISIISSDSQAMGRVGEVIIRTWQTAGERPVVIGSFVHICDPYILACMHACLYIRHRLIFLSISQILHHNIFKVFS